MHSHEFLRTTPGSSWVASIIDAVREQISNSTLRQGDRLPPEGELASQFGSGRYAVREAVNFLINWQLLEVRPGDGIFIRSDLDLVERCRERNRIGIRDHLEAQCLLEIQTVQLAARRRTLDDVRRLRACLAKRGEYNINDELDDFVDRDQALHAAIAVASHNVVLQSMYRSFSSSFHSQYLAIFADNELHEPGLDAHANVIEAVIYGDEEVAAQAVQAMFKPMLDKLSLLFERDKEAIIRRAER